jgi:hypothetical protein
MTSEVVAIGATDLPIPSGFLDAALFSADSPDEAGQEFDRRPKQKKSVLC